MTFVSSTLSDLPQERIALNGLQIVNSRYPSEEESKKWKCAYDATRNCLFMALKSSSGEMRDGAPSIYLLTINNDPIVIYGLSESKFHQTSFLHKYDRKEVVKLISEGATTLLEREVSFTETEVEDSSAKKKEIDKKGQFEDWFAKNRIRKKNQLKEAIRKKFPFLFKKRSALQTVGLFAKGAMEGTIGPQCIKTVSVLVEAGKDKAAIQVINHGKNAVRNLEIQSDAVIDLVSFNYRNKANNYRINGFDYEQFPAIKNLDYSISIEKINGGTSKTFDRNLLGNYAPKSANLGIKMRGRNIFESAHESFLIRAEVDSNTSILHSTK